MLDKTGFNMKTTALCKQLRALGIPKLETERLIRDITKWSNKCGDEWCAQRLKDLQLELINRRSGGSYRAPWVKRNSSGYPKGVWSYLYRLGLRGNDKVFARVHNVFRCYTSIYLKQVTDKQRKKFVTSMTSRKETGLDAKFAIIPFKIGLRKKGWKPSPLFASQLGENKVSPSLEGTCRRDDVDRHIQFAVHTSSYLDDLCRRSPYWTKRHCVPPSIMMRYVVDPDRIMVESLIRPSLSSPAPSVPVEVLTNRVGNISTIQESGGKLRAVANPGLVSQIILEPLKQFLLQVLRENVPTDCTHDQDSGVRTIQSWLQEGKTCHSVDLSDATNTFPRDIQFDLLMRIVDNPDKVLVRGSVEGMVPDLRYRDFVTYFETIAAGRYMAPTTLIEAGYGSFYRGQPLGAGPSFPCFALAHNVLLYGICTKCGYERWDQMPFRVLGDDVVISDDRVHHKYREALKNLGVEVSLPKTLSSSYLAEFAGRVITPFTSYLPLKWKEANPLNVIDICKSIGRRALGIIPVHYRPAMKVLAPIPEALGGLGWNPKGLSLDQRLSSEVGKVLTNKASDDKITIAEGKALNSLLSEYNQKFAEIFSEVQSYGFVERLRSEYDRPGRGSFLRWLHCVHKEERVLLFKSRPGPRRVRSVINRYQKYFWVNNCCYVSQVSPPGDPRVNRNTFVLSIVDQVTDPLIRRKLLVIAKQRNARLKKRPPLQRSKSMTVVLPVPRKGQTKAKFGSRVR